ncbi:sugar porter family MFS transporter [Bailinhaonella thermotolerans]|uniref:Sugar porter family MFS transporter n=1 Tax=Bailinhaonella thermotolerans TaxID=1070861 RepID=A0A3A4AQI2_9ACTN|nr:sugar porter family MFS transporter [Bailinhaonella thermotolerans]RJL21731.1 sugar porter family MFS transporter [Bailinhaonella thermotolerans]
MAQAFSGRPVTHHEDEERPHRRKVYFWAAVGALGGFLFGYDTGVVSGALLFIKHDFHLGAFEQGLVVSILLLTAMAGALIAGRTADRVGRRPLLIGVAVVFTLGLLAASLAPNYVTLLVARAVLGLGVGGASAIVPVYLSEIAPARIRGALVSANQLLITIGIVVSYVVDLVFAGTENWRAMFAVGIVVSALMLIGLFFVPETPVWLQRNGREDQARRVLCEVVPADRVDGVLRSYRTSGDQGGGKVSWRRLLRSSARPALVIGLALAAFQQFAGINTIIYYAPTIMEDTGLNASNSIVYSVIIGSINVVMTLVAMPLTDKAGRRRLLIISLTGMTISLIPLGLTFTKLHGSGASTIALVCILVYIASFAIGLGPVFWLLNSEIYPPSVRGEAASLATMVNWLSNFIVGQAFLPVAAAIGQGPTFWIFAVIALLALLFVIKFVPETKGRSFEEIDRALQRRL